jgi:hypothetical protein
MMLGLSLPSARGDTAAKSGIAQARKRLGEEPLAYLFTTTADRWAIQSADRHRWRGLSLHGLDGTTLRAPDSPENWAAFGGQCGNGTRNGSAYPMVRFVAVMAPQLQPTFRRSARRLTRRTPTWPCLLAGRPFGHPGLDVERAVDDLLSAPVLLQDHRSWTGSSGANTLPVTYFGWRCAGLRPPRAGLHQRGGKGEARLGGGLLGLPPARPIALPARTRPV